MVLFEKLLISTKNVKPCGGAKDKISESVNLYYMMLNVHLKFHGTRSNSRQYISL